MADKPKRCALYLRVSTKEQTTENQRKELTEAAAARGWEVTQVYEDAGISGSKGRDKRPALDKMLKDASRGRFDVLAVWSVDRIGRSLADLISTMDELRHASRDLFIFKQQMDTTSPQGRMLFQLLGAFAEFEREMIVARVNAGVARAKAKGTHCGRPELPRAKVAEVRKLVADGLSSRKISEATGVSATKVLSIKAEMAQQAA